MKDPVRYPTVLQKTLRNRTVIYPRYLFQSGPQATFPRQFFSWWRKHFQYPESPVKNIKIRLKTETNRTLASLFSRKKSPKYMLTLTQPNN